MKRIIALLFVLGTGTMLWASTGNNMGRGLEKRNIGVEEGIIFFDGTWKDALKKSAKENKLIFMDAYASWCGPCKLMASKTFTDAEVGQFFNANFINVKMDMEKSEDGPRLSRKYGLTAYPTLYFINGDEEVVYQALGYHKPAQLISVGEEALAK